MRNTYLALTTILTLLFSIQALAFRVSPMVASFNAKGQGTSQTFQIENNTNEAVALELETLTRAISIDGKEVRKPTEDFIIYPLQLTLKPKQTRNVRVTWVGDQNPKVELPYRLVVRQLSVDVNEKKQETHAVKLNFLFEYIASLYVTPNQKIYPKLVVKSISRKGKHAEAIIENIGTQHVLLNKYNLIVKHNDKEHLINKKSIDKLLSTNFLAKSKVKIKIPLPQLPKGKISLLLKEK